jgi:hypothetical protein
MKTKTLAMLMFAGTGSWVAADADPFVRSLRHDRGVPYDSGPRYAERSPLQRNRSYEGYYGVVDSIERRAAQQGQCRSGHDHRRHRWRRSAIRSAAARATRCNGRRRGRRRGGGA